MIIGSAAQEVCLPLWVLYHLRHWQDERKTGKIVFNYHQGTIGSINMEERVTSSHK